MSRSLKVQFTDPKDIRFLSFFGGKERLEALEAVRIPVKALNLYDFSSCPVPFGTSQLPAGHTERALEGDLAGEALGRVMQTLKGLGYRSQTKALPGETSGAVGVDFFAESLRHKRERVLVRKGGGDLA